MCEFCGVFLQMETFEIIILAPLQEVQSEFTVLHLLTEQNSKVHCIIFIPNSELMNHPFLLIQVHWYPSTMAMGQNTR